MDAIVIATGSVMIAVLFGVGSQIIRFHQQIVRGPQCARCPLYQTACKEFDAPESCTAEADIDTIAPEMGI